VGVGLRGTFPTLAVTPLKIAVACTSRLSRGSRRSLNHELFSRPDRCTVCAGPRLSHVLRHERADGTNTGSGETVPQGGSSRIDALLDFIRSAFPSAQSLLIFVHGYNSDFFAPFQLGATGSRRLIRGSRSSSTVGRQNMRH
jgi:hypothetical protein